ncbi:hypothetical protein PMAYCL1PPCAC_31232 [Pristionchus mayeri]|uniref:Uncharacterized protein n=1 Tax=Pristionchus mayeri TaxID=1317129 RepID=A0AAN5DEJ1_9BILA|nr:hypothetical protein PMAYCL1PPCAC_31232 [Pristionchus mayeri]
MILLMQFTLSSFPFGHRHRVALQIKVGPFSTSPNQSGLYAGVSAVVSIGAVSEVPSVPQQVEEVSCSVVNLVVVFSGVPSVKELYKNALINVSATV